MKYHISEQIIGYYQEHLNLIRSKSNNNIHLNLIKEFDPENQFYHKLINGKNNLDITERTNLTTIGDNFENKIKNSTDDEYDIIKNNLNEEIKINDTKINKNELQNIDIKKSENQNFFNSKIIVESLKKEILSLKIKSIKSDYEILKVNERLNYESIINLAYSNIAQKKISYLEAYIQSLKNIIINLSNPYNFNLWRKISNILLKNIFIILKNKGFTINQNKDKTVYDDLSEIIHKIKKPNYKIIKKLNKYKNCLEEIKQTSVLSLSPAADKKRVFNLITIEKDKTAEIKCSLSIDFLFFLKEKGNKFSHFDESLLNYLLFNDLNIIEENEFDKTVFKSEKINKKESLEEDVKVKNNKSEETKEQKNTGKIINEYENNKVKEKSIASINVGINYTNLKNEATILNKLDKIK